MKPAALWKLIRAEYDELLEERGFTRLKPTPPAWTKKVGKQACTVWFKSRSVGWIPGEGGGFTGSLQLASKPMPGIDWAPGTFTSDSLADLLTPAEKKKALALFAQVVARRTSNANEKPVPSGFFSMYLDESDVKAWCQLYGGALVRKLDKL
jgi:hypothetical protein